MDADLLTDRLALRALPPAAAALVVDQREAAAAELGFEISPDWPLRERLDAVGAQASVAAEDAQWGMWVIVDRADQLVVGDIGFTGPPSRERSVEIDYSIVPSHRGRGYTAEATTALSRWALAQPDVEVVFAGCEIDNVASIRTLRRAGFVETAQTEIEIRWSRRRG